MRLGSSPVVGPSSHILPRPTGAWQSQPWISMNRVVTASSYPRGHPELDVPRSGFAVCRGTSSSFEDRKGKGKARARTPPPSLPRPLVTRAAAAKLAAVSRQEARPGVASGSRVTLDTDQTPPRPLKRKVAALGDARSKRPRLEVTPEAPELVSSPSSKLAAAQLALLLGAVPKPCGRAAGAPPTSSSSSYGSDSRRAGAPPSSTLSPYLSGSRRAAAVAATSSSSSSYPSGSRRAAALPTSSPSSSYPSGSRRAGGAPPTFPSSPYLSSSNRRCCCSSLSSPSSSGRAAAAAPPGRRRIRAAAVDTAAAAPTLSPSPYAGSSRRRAAAAAAAVSTSSRRVQAAAAVVLLPVFPRRRRRIRAAAAVVLLLPFPIVVVVVPIYEQQQRVCCCCCALVVRAVVPVYEQQQPSCFHLSAVAVAVSERDEDHSTVAIISSSCLWIGAGGVDVEQRLWVGIAKWRGGSEAIGEDGSRELQPAFNHG
ncbi:hypothetical protein BDZ97DRAFT_1923554 [Flammula alnicola]|nr:hypothetical protein BDZ97DRAFT_1923554 [Flammula alnicola]